MIRLCAVTDIGLQRLTNQDGFYFDGSYTTNETRRFIYYETNNSNIIAVVADGVGSTRNGEYAVQKAFEYLRQSIPIDSKETLQRTINEMNSYIVKNSLEDNMDSATTLAGVCILNEIVLGFNVGDSRLYSINNGYIEKLSIDDTAVGLLSELNENLERDQMINTKLPLLQYLGKNEKSIDAHIKVLSSWKYLLLCTDGLTDVLSIDDIETIIAGTLDIKECIQKLLDTALQSEANDNVTIMIIEKK